MAGLNCRNLNAEGMNKEKWDKIESIIHRVLELPKGKQDAFIETTCSDDPELKGEVTLYLESIRNSEGWLENLQDYKKNYFQEISQDIRLHPYGQSLIGKQVGSYLIKSKIGEGGMGTVFLAERSDQEFEHRVAIKIIRRGRATAENIKRFKQEQNILAGLTHSSIARLYDGRITDDGFPYIIMEYVDGTPINTYCSREACTIDQKLGLFSQTLQAVRHAHENLVIHRDLKPDNILVDQSGTIKILDFGISKLLDDDESNAITQTTARILTPRYAAPEQIRDENVTTATDLYSLGIIFYELLAGTGPFKLKDLSRYEVEQVILNKAPAAPSTKTAQKKVLSGDLDAMALKAIRKEPDARYRTADSFLDDIVRYRNQSPVSARRDTVSYLTKKFVLRHRNGLVATAAVVLLIVGFAVFYGIQITQERNRAERYAVFLTDLFRSPDPFQASENTVVKDITVREYMDKAAKRVRLELKEDPTMQIALLETIAEVQQNLGYKNEARLLYQDLLAMNKKQYDEGSPEIIESLRRVADVTGNFYVADSLFRLQLALASELEESSGLLTAKSKLAYSGLLSANGRFKMGLKLVKSAVNVFRDAGPEYRQKLAEALLIASRINRSLNNLQQADTLIREGLAIQKQLTGIEHPKTAAFMNVAATVAIKLGQLERAENLTRRSLKISQKTLGDMHHSSIKKLNDLSYLLNVKGDYKEAIEIQRRVVTLNKSKYGKLNSVTAASMQNLAAYLTNNEKLEEAKQLLQEVYNIFRKTLPTDHQLIAFPMLSLTDIYFQLKQYSRAEITARTAVKQLQLAYPDGHEYVAIAKSRLGEALARQQLYKKAAPLLTESCKYLKLIGGGLDHKSKACKRLELLPDYSK